MLCREFDNVGHARAGAWFINSHKQDHNMSHRLKVADHVSWNSEAGHVSGIISAVHSADFDYKGHTRRASNDEVQYEIDSEKTDHVAAHRDSVLTRID